MEEYIALSHIFKLSTELAKDPALFYQLGYLFGYRGEELILILLYSHFNYKLGFYFILMSKYYYLSSFPIFAIHVHHQMLALGMDNYYFEVLRRLNLLHVLWPDLCLHASTHLNVVTTPTTSTSPQSQ